MQTQNVPRTGARYWTALCLASVFGANLGDFVSHNLHLGHDKGLPPLALIFGLALLAESRLSGRRRLSGNEAFYWVAIVTLRTAATNLGDLATHDFKLSAGVATAAATLLLGGFLLAAALSPAARLRAQDARQHGVPATDGLYWAAMLTAGTLGTVAGDGMSDDLGLGTGWASVILCVIVAGTLALRAVPAMAGIAGYWLVVVAIRTAGTTVGDFTAFRHGLGLGLPLSTAASGLALLAVLLIWPRQAPAPAEQPA